MRTRLEDMLTFPTERLAMFTSEQYRAKAAEYIELAKTANTPNEVREFEKLEQSFTELADNQQWVADHHEQTLHAAEDGEAAKLTFPAVENACPSMTGNGGYQPSGEDSSALGTDTL
jgi:hypothetical protein